MELDSIGTIASGVEAGLGAGFVSVSAIGRKLRLGTLRIVNLEGTSIERDFSLIYRAGQQPVGPVAAFHCFAQFDMRS